MVLNFVYFSQNAKELSATDILFSMILCQSNYIKKDEDENFEIIVPPEESLGTIYSYQILLSGPELQPKCLPHIVHIIPISESVHLIYLLEVGNSAVAASLYETFSHLHTLQLLQSQREKSILQPAFENFELATKKLNDSLKKNRNSHIEVAHKQLMKKWDIIKKKYYEFFKTSSDEALLRAETVTLTFLEDLNDFLKLTSIDESIIKSTRSRAKTAGEIVQTNLKSYNEFFKVKSIKNFSLGSYPFKQCLVLLYSVNNHS